MKQPTNAEIRKVLKSYGRAVIAAERRKRPNTPREVGRYCRALQRVWDLAKRIASREVCP